MKASFNPILVVSPNIKHIFRNCKKSFFVLFCYTQYINCFLIYLKLIQFLFVNSVACYGMFFLMFGLHDVVSDIHIVFSPFHMLIFMIS